MEEIRILTCPVCGQSVYFPADEATRREELKAEAWAHLDDHRLPENKHGIYGVMMVDRMDRRTVEGDGPPDPSPGMWVDQLAPQPTG